MRIPFWLRPFATHLNSTRTRRTPHRKAFHPRVERLEDRATPSTVQLTNANFASGPSFMTPVGSTLYFEADDGINGVQLWRTGGRPGDAVRVDHGSQPIDRLVQEGKWLYFFTDNGNDTYSLWRNDSTSSPSSPSQAVQEVHGESVIDPAYQEPLRYGPYQLTAVGHDIYFGARSAEGIWELWKTTGADGANPSTAPFLYPGFQAYSSFYSNTPYGLQAAGSELYFSADYVHDGTTDNVLWGSDGTLGATSPVRDGSGGLFTENTVDTVAAGADLYAITGGNLWRVSGLQAATVATVGDGAEIYFASDGYHMTAVGDSLYFTTAGPNGVYDLWKSTGSQPTLVLQTSDTFVEPVEFVSIGSEVYLIDSGRFATGGAESHLWKTDGTPSGTEILKTFRHSFDFNFSQAMAFGLTAAGSTVYLDGPDGRLWQSGGTPESTQSTGINLGYWTRDSYNDISGSNPKLYSPLTAVGSTLYFASPVPAYGSSDLYRLNSPPVAKADNYAVNAGTALTVSAVAGVLANDTDTDAVDAGHLTASIVANSGPSHGTLSFNSDGSFTYTPDAGYAGADSFTYQASDGIDPSNVATVSLNVVQNLFTPLACSPPSAPRRV